MTTFYLPIILVLAAVVVPMLLLRIARDPILGICVFVFLSSITMMPELPVVGDRLVVADFVMLFTLLVTAFQGQLFRAPPPGLRLIDQLGLLFMFIITASSLLALMRLDDPQRVILFMFIYLYGYLCFRLIIRLVDTRERFVRVCLWWAAGATLVIVVGIVAATGIYKPAWTYDPVIMRINSTMKMSGQVASYLGPAMFILFFLAASRHLSNTQQIAVTGLLGAAAVVLLGAGNRTAFVIMVFSVVFGLLAVKLTAGDAVRRIPLVVAALGGVTAFLIYAVGIVTDTSERYSLIITSPYERALRMWSELWRDDSATLADWGGTRHSEITTAFANIPNHPFTGTGSGMFSATYNINEIHNTYITILAENGLFAFIAFVIWWGLIGMTLWRAAGQRRPEKLAFRLILGAFIALTLYQLTVNGLRQRPFWFVPAIALSAVAIARREQLNERAQLLARHYTFAPHTAVGT